MRAGGKGKSAVRNEDNGGPGPRRSATEPEVMGFWEWGSRGKRIGGSGKRIGGV